MTSLLHRKSTDIGLGGPAGQRRCGDMTKPDPSSDPPNSLPIFLEPIDPKKSPRCVISAYSSDECVVFQLRRHNGATVLSISKSKRRRVSFSQKIFKSWAGQASRRADFHSRRQGSYVLYRPRSFFTTGMTLNLPAVAVFGDHRVILRLVAYAGYATSNSLDWPASHQDLGVLLYPDPTRILKARSPVGLPNGILLNASSVQDVHSLAAVHSAPRLCSSIRYSRRHHRQIPHYPTHLPACQCDEPRGSLPA